MTKLLVRLFVKDYTQVHDQTVRRRYGMLGGSVGIVLNFLLFCFKVLSGLASASISMIADAVNNLSDAGSSIITLIGFKMSGKPADREHPFGHGRIEYISALLVAVVILLMGIELIRTSIDKIVSAEPAVFTPISVLILSLSILIKVWMYYFNRKISKTIQSQSTAAAAKDSLSDAAATSAVLVGVIVCSLTGYSIDGYIGLLVAAFILFTGYTTVKDALSPLLGQPASLELVSQIESMVLSHDEIVGMHDLIIHNYGPGRFMLSLHAEVPSDGDILKLHDTIDLIEKDLQSKFGCDAVIHMDPIETDNETINQARAAVRDMIYQLDPALSMHDFRMVTGPTHTNLIFDLVVPYNYRMSDRELTALLSEKIAEIDSRFYAVIHIDKSYVE